MERVYLYMFTLFLYNVHVYLCMWAEVQVFTLYQVTNVNLGKLLIC